MAIVNKATYCNLEVVVTCDCGKLFITRSRMVRCPFCTAHYQLISRAQRMKTADELSEIGVLAEEDFSDGIPLKDEKGEQHV